MGFVALLCQRLRHELKKTAYHYEASKAKYHAADGKAKS